MGVLRFGIRIKLISDDLGCKPDLKCGQRRYIFMLFLELLLELFFCQAPTYYVTTLPVNLLRK